jgi:hypothetical protein
MSHFKIALLYKPRHPVLSKILSLPTSWALLNVPSGTLLG